MNSRNVNIKMKAKCQATGGGAILPSCTFITALKLKTYIHAIIDKTFSIFLKVTKVRQQQSGSYSEELIQSN